MLQKRISTSSSSNKYVFETYQYPEIDPYGSTPSIISEMVGKNMISPVIEQTTSIGTLSSQTVTSGRKIEYAKFNSSIIMPSKLYEKEFKPSGADYALRTQVLSYTTKGNPKEIDNDGVRTVYLWGYGDRYLIAKIENATYGNVTTALDTLTPETIAARSTPLESDFDAINNLRNILPLKDKSMITTYTYLPSVGITSETDPSGRTIFYEYDSFGRLERVKDEDKNVLKEHKYHYAQ
jgi:YD repeat-containing protein